MGLKPGTSQAQGDNSNHKIPVPARDPKLLLMNNPKYKVKTSGFTTDLSFATLYSFIFIDKNLHVMITF